MMGDTSQSADGAAGGSGVTAWGARVLLVAAHTDLADPLARELGARGIDLEHAASDAAMKRACSQRVFDLVLVSDRMPHVRTAYPRSALWTARFRVMVLIGDPAGGAAELARQLELYDAGACDLVAESIAPAVLAAKIAVHVQRPHLPSGGVRRLGRLVVDLTVGLAFVDGEMLDLSRSEFALLARLAERPHTVVPRHELAAQVWRPGWRTGDSAFTTKLHRLKAKLRARLGRDVIETVKGRGCLLHLALTPADGNAALGLPLGQPR